MNVLMSIWTFFANNFLKTPAYFIGLITIVGYILLKKKWYDVFSGFIKATVGYKILLVGSGGLSSTFKPIISALSSKFGIDALVLDTYVGQVAAQSAIETVGKSFSQVMVLLLIAFIFNILLVLGIAGVISPVAIITENLIDTFILIAVSTLVWIFAWKKKELVKWQGIVMLAIYTAYLVYICMR